MFFFIGSVLRTQIAEDCSWNPAVLKDEEEDLDIERCVQNCVMNLRLGNSNSEEFSWRYLGFGFGA
jgi:hypothetical protein